jgi:hypothetical protein
MNIGIVTLFFVLALLGWYLSFTAARLDRHHLRVETSLANLDAALHRRVGVALEISNSGYLDPASSLLLASAAHEAREAAGDKREKLEKELSDDLASIYLEADEKVREMIRAAQERAALAHALHADAVRSVHVVREKILVRLFRLAGHAPTPQYFEGEFTHAQE